MIAKYRVDFYYWNYNSGFSHIKTVEYTNTLFNAKEYVNNIDIDYSTEILYNAIMVRVVDNENDYVLSEYWWKLNENYENNCENYYYEDWDILYDILYKSIRDNNDLIENNVWVYEREAGDGGLVIAESYEKALDELRKVYDDIDERIDPDCEKYGWGLSVLAVGDYESKGNVFITHPY